MTEQVYKIEISEQQYRNHIRQNHEAILNLNKTLADGYKLRYFLDQEFKPVFIASQYRVTDTKIDLDMIIGQGYTIKR